MERLVMVAGLHLLVFPLAERPSPRMHTFVAGCVPNRVWHQTTSPNVNHRILSQTELPKDHLLLPSGPSCIVPFTSIHSCISLASMTGTGNAELQVTSGCRDRPQTHFVRWPILVSKGRAARQVWSWRSCERYCTTSERSRTSNTTLRTEH